MAIEESRRKTFQKVVFGGLFWRFCSFPTKETAVLKGFMHTRCWRILGSSWGLKGGAWLW